MLWLMLSGSYNYVQSKSGCNITDSNILTTITVTHFYPTTIIRVLLHVAAIE